MAKTVRLNKANALMELQERLAWGQRLIDLRIENERDFAEAMVQRLEWYASVMQLLPMVPKGIEAAADFNRAGVARRPLTIDTPLELDAMDYRQAVSKQLESLERTLERVRKFGTRQLTQG